MQSNRSMWRSFFVSVCMVWIVAVGFAQFQGRINYEITYKIDNPELDGIDKQLPYRCKFVTDGKSWKATWKSRIGEDYTIIYRAEEDSLYHLVTLGAKSLSVASIAEEVIQFKHEAESFEVTNGDIKALYTRAKLSAEPIDETYFLVTASFAPIKEAQYLKLLR